MCEANAYIRKKDNTEELLLKSVDKVMPRDGEELFLENIFGQRKIIKGKIIEMALVDHRIVIEKVE